MPYARLRLWSALVLCLLIPSVAAAQKIATGSGPGSVPPTVRIFDASGTESTLIPYPAGFAGGVRVALGDVNGDGVLDIVTGAGPGGGPHVRVWNGTDLTEIWGVFAYDPAFPGGVTVAAGDVNGDGRADIITGAGPGASPQVKVWDGATFTEIANFLAYPAGFGGGVNVASADVDGDGRADIITGAGPGGGPHVRVWSGVDSHEITGFFAYHPAFPGGVNVAAADVDGDGHADIVTGAGPGGGPHVRVWSGADNHELTGWFAYDPAFPGGVVVATMDLDRDGRSEIMTGPATGAPLVRIWSGLLHELWGQYWAFDPFSSGGVTIGSSGGSSTLRFTSANNTTFSASTPGTFSVTTVGGSVPVLTVTGALPSGVTFTDNTDRTGTLTGTPAANSGGSYPLTFTATISGRPPVTQPFTLTVNQAPAITSAAAATFGLGGPGTFTVTTTGFPRPTLSSTGALPSGVTFTPNSDGTATIAGTPAPGSGGTYTLTITASNGAGADAIQTFVLTVNGSPAFTSANAATFTVGSPGSFTVTTVASPTAALSVSGALPSGVTFVDNGNGTGTFSGTPAPGTSGTHSLTFTATNSVGTTPQSFTLTVRQGPAITSASATTFIAGMAGAFAITTTGVPTPTLTVGGALPAGVIFTDNGNGTASLAGTPGLGTGGSYPLTITAANGVGSNAVQSFTLTVQQAPAFTSAPATTFSVGVPGTFTVTTSGVPAITTITPAGTLPTGVTFVNNSNGTATLSGTPASGTGGVYPLTFTINNGIGGNVVQTFSLTVTEAPTFTSATATTFTVGTPGTFSVTTTGQPGVTTITLGGAALPTGVTFVSNGDGTATLSGTAATGTGGTYALTFTINNGIGGDVVQNFTLTIGEPPTITSAPTATFTLNTAGTTFQVVMTGTPAPTVSVTSGTLPTGLTLSAAGLLSGTPTQSGSFPVTLTATNGTLPDATQAFTVLVNAPPAITSAAATTFTVGSPGTFTVVMTGFPAPTVAVTAGTLPAGVTLSPAGVLSGTPGPGTGGSYPVTLTATNGVGADAVQAFTLTVNEAPAITSANTATFLLNTAGTTFQVVMTGFPAPTVSVTSGVLPTGLTLSSAGLLSGTPTQSGSFPVTLTATNGTLPNGTQAFTVLVNAPPAITSATSDPWVVGTADSFTVTTTGSPTPTVSQTGTLPTGVTFTPATRVLAGTATQTGAFPLQFTATNGVNPDAVQNFTLNVVCPAINVTPSTMGDGLYLTAYGAVDFNATGSTGSTFTWGATGLPAGLTIDTNTGVVSGTPTNTVLAGPVAVTVTDNFGCQGSLNPTITVRPTTDNENYTGGVGHTQYAVGVAGIGTPHVAVSDNVKTGDNGPGALSVAFNPPSNGTVVEGSTDGTFTYTPNLNFAGPSDSFTYTLTDGNGVTNTGTVVINLSTLVWYVNSAGGDGDGRSHNPFNNLTSASTASGVNSTVYVHTGGATTTGSLVMETGQLLHGQGAVFSRNDLVIASGARPTLTGTVTLASNTAVLAVNFSGASPALTASATSFSLPSTVDQVIVTGGSSALSLTNVNATATGAITITNASFTNTSGAEVTINGGNIPVTLAATTTISSNAGRSVDITNRTGGTVAFNGAITDTSQGVFLNANTGSTINFTGGLALTTGTNPGFTATGGGTVNVTGSTNTITTTTGTALNVANTNIGASGLTFQSISAGTGADSAGSGIILDSTGASGGLTVTGTGSASSGGTIQHKNGANIVNPADGTITGTTGTGIFLRSTSDVDLSRMNLHDFSNYAIFGSNVNGFVLRNSVIGGVNGETSSSGHNIESSVSIRNLLGLSGFLGNNISGGIARNINIDNQSGTLNLTATGNNIHDTSNTVAGDDGFSLEAELTAIVVANISNNIFAAHKGDDFNLSLINTAAVDLTFNGNDMSGGNPGKLGSSVFILGASFNGTLEYDITGNTSLGAVQGGAIFVNKGSGTGTFSGQIVDNVIGDPAVPLSGAAQSVGIHASARGAGGSHTTLIHSNEVYEYLDRGIVLEAGEGSPALIATVTENTVSDFGDAINSLHGIHFDFGILSGDDAQITIDVRNNLIANAANEPQGGADFRMRTAGNNDTFIAGYTGGNSSANAQAYIDTQNPNGTTFSVTQAASGTYQNGPSVPLPPPTLPTVPPTP